MLLFMECHLLGAILNDIIRFGPLVIPDRSRTWMDYLNFEVANGLSEVRR